MTYRDRREARADRLDGWADKRQVRGSATLATTRERADMIPFGQPILVGHHSERGHRNMLDRIDNGYRRAFEDLNKADTMHSKAANIRAAADRAIYSDDDDAIDKLRARIAELEAERDRVKAYNTTCRKGAPDLSLLTPYQRGGLETQARHMPDYHARIKQQCPPYMLSNLSGNIGKQRKRLEQLEREATTRLAGNMTNAEVWEANRNV